MVAEAFALLEKEPRTFTDISVFAQTLNLKRFKHVTNTYVAQRRGKKRGKVYKQLSSSDGKKSQLCNKFRYFGRLALTPVVPEGEIIMEGSVSGEYAMTGIRLDCDVAWPVCILDHTYKSRCTSYFHAKVQRTAVEFLDGYFDSSLPSKSAGENKARSEYDSLLIERNVHYCGNSLFANKVTALLRHSLPVADAFPSELVDIPVNESVDCAKKMAQYISLVLKYKMPTEAKPKSSPAPAQKKPVPTRRTGVAFKTMTTGELSKVMRESLEGERDQEEDFMQRNSVAVPGYFEKTAQFRKKIRPLNIFLERIAKKTGISKRGEKVNNTPSVKFLRGIMDSESPVHI